MEEAHKIKPQNFCPTCGYEGYDMECPVCHVPMESLEAEIDKIKDKEEEGNDLIDDDLSLEQIQRKEENSAGKEPRENDEDL